MEEELKNLESVRQTVKKEFEKNGFFPKVSIIIPVYNGANYMRDAIDSALTQTYSNIEIIVVNDGSTDNGETERIAMAYGKRIRYYNKPNGGVATALNLGIEKMEGEYFSWLSHDDMYTPQKIEEEARALMYLQDRTTIILEGYQVIDAFGNHMYTVNMHNLYSPKQLTNSMFIIMHGGANGCTLLIHKSHFRRVGLFDPQLPTTQDYDLWFRMFRNQTVHFLKSSNVLSRSHEGQGSKILSESHIKECNKLWIRMMDELTLEEKIKMSGSEYIFYRDLYNYLRGASNYQAAINHARKKALLIALAEYEKSTKSECIEVIGDCCGVTPQFIEKELLPLRKNKGNKPRLLFYPTHGDTEDSSISNIIKNADMLSSKYDVIIYTYGHTYDNDYPNCTVVKKLTINSSKQEQLEELLNILLLLKVDIYIYSYCYCETELTFLEQVEHLGIKTVAWSHGDYYLSYSRESLRDRIAFRKKYLPKADAVVWITSESQVLYGLSYSNSICIPALPENKTFQMPLTCRADSLIAQKWIHLLNILLSDDEQKRKEYFESEQIALTEDIVINVLNVFDVLRIDLVNLNEQRNKEFQDAINNYNENMRWKECYMAVVNSKSWKLTAPLRFLMGIFKNN